MNIMLAAKSIGKVASSRMSSLRINHAEVLARKPGNTYGSIFAGSSGYTNGFSISTVIHLMLLGRFHRPGLLSFKTTVRI